MRFRCRKVRSAQVSYAIPGNPLSEPRNGAQAMLVPVEAQHATPGGLVEMHIWTFLPCPYEEGKYYDIDLKVTQLESVTELRPA